MATNPNSNDDGGSSLSRVQNPSGKERVQAVVAERIQWIAAKPKKGARIIARTFYRELRRAGWADGDIMAIADELLACLLASLQEYRLKTETPVGQTTERT